MSYALPPLAVTGAFIPASWGNTNRDNWSASPNGLASATGQLFYSTGLGALAALAVGSGYSVLELNSGATAPAWRPSGTLQHILPSNYALTTSQADTGCTLTLNRAGNWFIVMEVEWLLNSPTDNDEIVYAHLYVNGVDVFTMATRIKADLDWRVATYPFLSTTGAEIVKIRAYKTAGGVNYMTGNSRLYAHRA